MFLCCINIVSIATVNTFLLEVVEGVDETSQVSLSLVLFLQPGSCEPVSSMRILGRADINHCLHPGSHILLHLQSEIKGLQQQCLEEWYFIQMFCPTSSTPCQSWTSALGLIGWAAKKSLNSAPLILRYLMNSIAWLLSSSAWLQNSLATFGRLTSS